MYLIYNYIRLCSILKKSGVSEEEIKKEGFQFTDPAELCIARQLAKF